MTSELEERHAKLVMIARRAAHAAALVHRQGRSARLDIHTKTNASDIATQVDRSAERAAGHVIQAARPRDSLLGEEGVASAQGQSSIRWIIDPLDGTTNYTLGLPHYCSSVAAFDQELGCVVAGAIESESLGVSYWAGLDGGAWRQRNAEDAPVRLEPHPRSLPRILLTGLSYDPDIRARQLVELTSLARDFDDVRSLGSAALALCLVADRTAEAYVESDLYEYDWAAGALIASEAGAIVDAGPAPRGGVSARWK
ncbi:MAG: inositol monophosphatase [Propionibacteriaceae bacterium]|jgi:myo-inositol-1(or 4)-monophosphatase|nr:inositol monophosphatase [Propionibacteriaceae bacterium]